MNELIEKLCSKNRTLYYFNKISKIPRCTDNEKGISDYIYKWGIEQGLEVIQEECLNIIIKKPGTLGYEESEPILFQAHLDMVCTKLPDSNHDFTQDAINWNVEGDWISSSNGTSLGADCGIGVALIMQILEDKIHKHPPVEVIFTVREESDMYGAYTVNTESIKSKRMINLDTSPDNKLLSGTCGGTAIEIKLPLERTEEKPDMVSLELQLTGLKGGHSGHDINKGYGNSLILMGRIIYDLKKNLEIQIEKLWGGGSRLSIPSESYSLIKVNKNSMETFKNRFNTIISEIKNEYIDLVPEINISYKDISNFDSRGKVLTEKSANALLSIILLIPNGINQMSNKLLGTVESSINLGVIDMDDRTAIFKSEIRTSYDSTKEELIDKCSILANNFSAKVLTHSKYPSWAFKAESYLRNEITETFQDMYGCDMEVYTVHAGNEIGILLDKFGDMDAVAMGPTRLNFHTPNEKLSISSSINFEKFLWQILEKLK